MIEKEISARSQGFDLAGTLCLPEPEGRFPVVLMLHGSGPLDRDENMKGQRLDVFNVLAHHLADAGIASVRYDKRGCGQSTGDYYRTGHADLVADAVVMLDYVAASEFADAGKLYLLGHSEGCVIAPQVSDQRRRVAGLVLLCPFIDRMESILMKQAAQLETEFKATRGLGAALQKLMARLMGMSAGNQGRLIARLRTSTEDTWTDHFQKVPATALREMLDLDPAALYGKVTCPMLIVGGAKDLQCDPDDVARIAEAASVETEFHVIPNLTHVLRFDETSILGSAGLLDRPMEPIVVETVVNWLRRN